MFCNFRYPRGYHPRSHVPGGRCYPIRWRYYPRWGWRVQHQYPLYPKWSNPHFDPLQHPGSIQYPAGF